MLRPEGGTSYPLGLLLPLEVQGPGERTSSPHDLLELLVELGLCYV